eukprot:CAMPEP_0119012194 /NCGR_PEP_ID=MMETSP1176-20130426/6140_1 /TAXON_ID=265551 /ORGANISM="Synedropsis recta cf, Strain CCMP1620" /LENGTH=310 /DNA_ID=CAMNT_0006965113 /DNA_START=24 /DNA_END=956 /DNA_ORIENTATION=-
MKIHSTILTALCFASLNAGAAAFSVNKGLTAKSKSSSVVLRSTPPFPSSTPSPSLTPVTTTVEPMFPLDLPTEIVQGGKTVRTYEMPLWAERVQMEFKTNGRPLKGKVELWLGPLRVTHQMEFDVQDGKATPFRATLKFKMVGQTLKITSSEGQEFPILASIAVPSEERSAELAKITEGVWNKALPTEKQRLQGGAIQGGGGAIRYVDVAPDVDAVQVVFWSKDTSKKSLKAKIEVIQGPNNPKQIFDLACGGGSQPYHCVFETPGPGWQVRVTNKKFMEDGLFEFAVVPYEIGDTMGNQRSVDKKDWWQ